MYTHTDSTDKSCHNLEGWACR